VTSVHFLIISIIDCFVIYQTDFTDFGHFTDLFLYLVCFFLLNFLFWPCVVDLVSFLTYVVHCYIMSWLFVCVVWKQPVAENGKTSSYSPVIGITQLSTSPSKSSDGKYI